MQLDPSCLRLGHQGAGGVAGLSFAQSEVRRPQVFHFIHVQVLPARTFTIEKLVVRRGHLL